MSHSEAHDRRVRKLTEAVRAYAAAADISPRTASLRVFRDSKELKRLEGTGSTKPATLERYEARLKAWKAGIDPDAVNKAQPVSA